MKDNNKRGRKLRGADAAEYTKVYRRGCELLERHMDLHDRPTAHTERRDTELREGVRLLQRAVALVPASWPAHWMLGKGHQALGDHLLAYQAFRQATRLCTTNADVPRELCMECLRLGKFAEAVGVARLAVQIERSDPGLQANLALALLLAGDIEEALGQAEQAVARSPQDGINRNLLAIILEVKEGRRRQPSSLAELES